jgi:hypothetical protein
MVSYTSPPIEVTHARDAPITRADVEFEGVEHGGPSFEARVFLNNPNAGPETPPTDENGYAGSFHVYGFGLQDGSAAAVPMRRSMIVTDAVKRLLPATSRFVVTVVPVLPDRVAEAAGDVLKIQNVAIRVS